MERSLDPELILHFDRNGDGVDKFEFVVGMAEELGLLDPRDVEQWVKVSE